MPSPSSPCLPSILSDNFFLGGVCVIIQLGSKIHHPNETSFSSAPNALSIPIPPPAPFKPRSPAGVLCVADKRWGGEEILLSDGLKEAANARRVSTVLCRGSQRVIHHPVVPLHTFQLNVFRKLFEKKKKKEEETGKMCWLIPNVRHLWKPSTSAGLCIRRCGFSPFRRIHSIPT